MRNIKNNIPSAISVPKMAANRLRKKFINTNSFIGLKDNESADVVIGF
jgi:hypothetical protein